jgi:hypothetical protein
VQSSEGSNPRAPGGSAAPRRSFIELRELPDLLLGAALGREVALRRVLGARKGGRIGAALAALLALGASVDRRAAFFGLASYAGFAALAALRHRQRGFGGYRTARLLLWTLPGPLLAALLARLLGVRSPLLVPLAAAAGWLLLERGLRVAAPAAQSAAAGGAPATDRTGVGIGSPGRE